MNPYAPPESDPDGVSPPALEAQLHAHFVPNYGDVLRLRARMLVSGSRAWIALCCVLLLFALWLLPEYLPHGPLRLGLLFAAWTLLLLQPLSLLLVALWYAFARAARSIAAPRDGLSLNLDGESVSDG